MLEKNGEVNANYQMRDDIDENIYEFARKYKELTQRNLSNKCLDRIYKHALFQGFHGEPNDVPINKELI